MRFDLLDEYSTLVPFGLGSSRKKAFQEPAAPDMEAQPSGHLGLLGKLSEALRPRESLMRLARLMTRSARVV